MSTFQVSACSMFTYILLTKTSHMVKCRVSVVGRHNPMGTEGVIYREPLLYLYIQLLASQKGSVCNFPPTKLIHNEQNNEIKGTRVILRKWVMGGKINDKRPQWNPIQISEMKLTESRQTLFYSSENSGLQIRYHPEGIHGFPK